MSRSNKSSYEEERAFQAQQAANDILASLHQSPSGSSPSGLYFNQSNPHSHTGSTYNETEGLLSRSNTEVYTPTSGKQYAAPSSDYLYIPGSAGNYINDEVLPQRRSSARRLFSICCAFDTLFMSILWTIVAINRYETLTKAWDEAVVHFTFKTSMFDIVILSFVRSVALLLHYWVAVSKMQITIIITTITSTVYIFLKLVYFDRNTNITFETYAILLISFVLCWVEVWLFETKVLKVENQVSRVLRPKYDETTGLLAHTRPYSAVGSDYNYSAFMTPSAATMPSTPGRTVDKHHQEAVNLDPRGQLLYSVATQSQIELNETVLWPDGWTTESEKEGVKVFSRAQRKAPNRLFLSESHYLCSLEDIFEVLYNQMGTASDWNKSIVHIEHVERLTSHLDILYTIGTSGGAGLIKSRDFLTLRYWLKERDTYYISSRDISDPIKPQSEEYTRGFNGPCGYVFFPSLDGSVKLTYVVNVDLKMPFVPAKVINSNLVDVIHNFHIALRNRIDDYLDIKGRSTVDS